MANCPGNILVVDDDMAHRTMLVTLLGGWGYATAEADDGALAVSAVAETPYDLVLMDVRMVKMSGIQALEKLKTVNPAVPVIIMTAYSSVESAVEALKKGAYDYLTKPLDFDTLRLTLERALEHVRLKGENRRLREKLGQRFDRGRIIGRSPVMLNLLETVERVAGSEATVLLWGESGTGKELIAGAIHHNSPRRRSPFVRINCAAIPETLFESEVFGHEKGAFTGAERRKEGFFAQADGGTLFLDEVSELPLTMQVKLLRALQEREFRRVGGEEVIKVDVRVIAATNQGLLERVRSGRFREDLFYRLNVVSLTVPPLRDRREDIALLVNHFLEQFAAKNGKDIKGLTPRAMGLAMKYGWPGNVRELMNAVERGVVLARGAYLEAEDLQLPPSAAAAAGAAPSLEAELPLDQVEKATILRTLAAVGNNKSEAARRLGITRKTLRKKLKVYGVMP